MSMTPTASNRPALLAVLVALIAWSATGRAQADDTSPEADHGELGVSPRATPAPEEEDERRTRETVLPPWHDAQRGDQRSRALFPFYYSVGTPRATSR